MYIQRRVNGATVHLSSLLRDAADIHVKGELFMREKEREREREREKEREQSPDP